MVEQYMRSLKLGAMAKRKSLIITSNLEFSQWNTAFGDGRLTQSIMRQRR